MRVSSYRCRVNNRFKGRVADYCLLKRTLLTNVLHNCEVKLILRDIGMGLFDTVGLFLAPHSRNYAMAVLELSDLIILHLRFCILPMFEKSIEHVCSDEATSTCEQDSCHYEIE